MSGKKINLQCYDELGDRWIEAKDDPIALLRAEAKFRWPWILERLSKEYDHKKVRILDAGCGAGFLSNALAEQEYLVTGIDQSLSSLEVAKKDPRGSKINYVQGDLNTLPFGNESFEVVCAMDVLEHLSDYKSFVGEVSRVLKPGGLFFFYTFNRTWLSYFLVIKSLEWFIPNCPPNLHLYSMFIKPSELRGALEKKQLRLEILKGVRPKLNPKSISSFVRGRIEDDFTFQFCKSTQVAYLGIAKKAEL